MGPDEADKDQAGTNRLELCFAHQLISPVHRWDELLLRRLNPHQTDALDHYKSHPQILLPSVNLKIIKLFLLLTTAEIGVVFFFVLQYIPFSFQSSATSNPPSFQTWPSAFPLKNHNVGQGSVWSLSWRELSICFFSHVVAERLKGGERGLDAGGVIPDLQSLQIPQGNYFEGDKFLLYISKTALKFGKIRENSSVFQNKIYFFMHLPIQKKYKN